MKLLLTGLNHRTAPIEVRERIAFDALALPDALDKLKGRPGVREGMILSTCNRVEVSVTAEDGADAEAAVESFLADARSIDRHGSHRTRIDSTGSEAIRHLFPCSASEPRLDGGGRTANSGAAEVGIRE